MTERRLGIMTFLVIFMLKNLDFLGGGGGGQNLGPFLQSCEMSQILQIYLCNFFEGLG